MMPAGRHRPLAKSWQRSRATVSAHNKKWNPAGGRCYVSTPSQVQRHASLTCPAKQVEVREEVAEPFVIRNNDVFIVRYNGDINRVAKPAIYKGANESRIVYPDKLIRLRPNADKMTPDFLVFALSSRSVRAARLRNWAKLLLATSESAEAIRSHLLFPYHHSSSKAGSWPNWTRCRRRWTL